MPLQVVHLALHRGHGLDERISQILFGVRRHALAAAHVVHDDGAVRLDVELACHDRPHVGVDVLDRHLVRVVGVLVETVAKPIDLGLPVEHRERHRLFEALQHLDGLFGQAELPAGRQVPALVLPGAEVVDGHDDQQCHEHADGRDGAVARLAVPEVLDDLSPLPEGVRHDQRKTGPRAPRGVLIPFRPDEANGHGPEHECRSYPPENTEDAMQHGSYPRQRSLSTARTVRNRLNAMNET